MKKRFYNTIRVFLCRKNARKNSKFSRNETILNIGHLAKAIGNATGFKLYTNSKFSSYQGKRDPIAEKITQDFFHSLGINFNVGP